MLRLNSVLLMNDKKGGSGGDAFLLHGCLKSAIVQTSDGETGALVISRMNDDFISRGQEKTE